MIRPALALALIVLLTPSTATAENTWPQWLGPHRDGVSAETGLLNKWPEGGPPRAWLFEDCGIGYAGPAIVRDRLYIMGGRDGTTELLALDTHNGELVWSLAMGTTYENDWGGGPRGTPTVDGDRVYALSATGILICARAADGEEIWRCTMEELGGVVPNWGYAESPLVDGDQLICTPGGPQGALAALDKHTGELVWQSAELEDEAGYASIVPATFHGDPQYVQLLPTQVVGVAPADGRLLWKADWPGRVAVIPTPLVTNDLVYVTSSYGAGCMLLKIGPDNEVTEIYRNKVMKSKHDGLIHLGQYIYGYSDGAGWICQDIDTGEAVWRERNALEKGAVGYADGMLYCLGEKEGVVALVEATPEGWREHGRFTLEPLTELRKPKGGIWVHPVIVDGRLYLRDQEYVFAFDVRR